MQSVAVSPQSHTDACLLQELVAKTEALLLQAREVKSLLSPSAMQQQLQQQLQQELHC